MTMDAWSKIIAIFHENNFMITHNEFIVIFKENNK